MPVMVPKVRVSIQDSGDFLFYYIQGPRLGLQKVVTELKLSFPYKYYETTTTDYEYNETFVNLATVEVVRRKAPSSTPIV